MKHRIKPSRQEDVLYLLWLTTTALESRVDGDRLAVLDRALVESGYNLLNDLSYTNARPAWVERAAREALVAESGRRDEVFAHLKARIDRAPNRPRKRKSALDSPVQF